MGLKETFVRTYLLAYNTGMALGWSFVLLRVFWAHKDGIDFPRVHKIASGPLQLFQSLAWAEVLHAMLGFVRADPFKTFTQILSRVMVVWTVIKPFPSAADSPFVTVMLIAWGITEIVRYSFFVCKQLNIEPRIIKWLRYSLFIVLYPTGASSEIYLLLTTLSQIKAKVENEDWHSIRMPNMMNFAFDFYWFCVFGALMYPPGFYMLYTHMLAQVKWSMVRPLQLNLRYARTVSVAIFAWAEEKGSISTQLEKDSMIADCHR